MIVPARTSSRPAMASDCRAVIWRFIVAPGLPTTNSRRIAVLPFRTRATADEAPDAVRLLVEACMLDEGWPAVRFAGGHDDLLLPHAASPLWS